MTNHIASRSLDAIRWLTASLMVACSVLSAGAFLVSGILTERSGLIICSLGWALITVPIYYRQHPNKKLKRGSALIGFAGGIFFLLGLVVHAGAL
jgi:hypothetical protein